MMKLPIPAAACCGLALALAMLCPIGAGAEASESSSKGEEKREQATPRKPPAFQNLRFQEDWSGHQPATSSLKRIALNSDGSAFLSLGGQLRYRAEFWENFLFSPEESRDDDHSLWRLRLHADFQLGSAVRFFVEGRSALARGRDLPGGNRTLDLDSVDLLNAFLDLKAFNRDDRELTFRLGRQELQFGKQRLVSPLDWSNSRRSFDGASAILAGPSWRLDTFWSRLVRVRKYDFNTSDTGTQLYGSYLNKRLAQGRLDADLYWLGLHRDSTAFGGVSGEEDRHSLGARLGGRIGAGFDFDAESTFQFGDHADRSIRAAMVSTQLGYRIPNLRLSPRILIGFDWASGDDDPEDDDVGTFNHLFPLGHAYLGFADITARQNVIDLNLGGSVQLLSNLSLRLDGHFLWRAEENDALYNPGGGVIREGGPGTPRKIGNEIDVLFRYAPARGWATLFGYSVVFAGDFIRATGPDEDIHFTYIGLQYTF